MGRIKSGPNGYYVAEPDSNSIAASAPSEQKPTESQQQQAIEPGQQSPTGPNPEQPQQQVAEQQPAQQEAIEPQPQEPAAAQSPYRQYAGAQLEAERKNIEVARAANQGSQAARRSNVDMFAERVKKDQEIYDTLHDDHEAEKKRQKNRALIAAISDGISSLANLYFTANGAPNIKLSSLSAANQERYDQVRKEREGKMELLLARLRASGDKVAAAQLEGQLAAVKEDAAVEQASNGMSAREAQLQLKAVEGERAARAADINSAKEITAIETAARKAIRDDAVAQSTISRNKAQAARSGNNSKKTITIGTEKNMYEIDADTYKANIPWLYALVKNAMDQRAEEEIKSLMSKTDTSGAKKTRSQMKSDISKASSLSLKNDSAEKLVDMESYIAKYLDDVPAAIAHLDKLVGKKSGQAAANKWDKRKIKSAPTPEEEIDFDDFRI